MFSPPVACTVVFLPLSDTVIFPVAPSGNVTLTTAVPEVMLSMLTCISVSILIIVNVAVAFALV